MDVAKVITRVKSLNKGPLERTYHPGFFRRLKRRLQNVFKTIRDSITEFVEMMDVDYKGVKEEAIRKADIVVLRKYGVVRHLGE